MSLFYKHAKANEPRSNSYNNGFTTNPYGSSLSALDTAWKSVVAAKQELSSVDTRLRQAVSPAADKKNNQASFPPPPKQKSKDNQNIEKRVVYKYADGSYHKENIPPKSFPVPCSKYADFRICEGNTENIVPTRRKLYKEDRDVSHQIDFNCETNKDSVKEDQYKNTSLAGRSLLKMDHSSYALNRLKERILQQKLNSSLSSIQTNETPFPQKIFHKEEDVVNENKSQGTQLEEVKRKVAAAPAAPSYKGFNQTETTYSKTNDTHTIRKKRQLDHGRAGKEKSSIEKKRPVKNKQAKSGKGKAQRIIAPKKPTAQISTSSWRVGQDIQRKIKQELKAANKPPADGPKKSKHVNSTSTDTTSHGPNSRSKSALSSEADTPDVIKPQDEVTDSKFNIVSDKDEQQDANLDDSNDSLQEQFLDDQLASGTHELKGKVEQNGPSSEEVLDSIKENRNLSKTAKDVLKEISLLPAAHDKETGKKVIVAVVDTGLTKSKKSKLTKKSPPVKRKLDEELNTKRKIRHYDQEDIQRYMAKQQAERRRQRIEQKKNEKIQKEIQEKKLKELFNKQKTAVKENLDSKKPQSHGSTFIKQHKSVKDLKDALVRIQEAAVEPKKVQFPAPTSSSSPTRLQRSDISNGDEIFMDSLDDDPYSPPIKNVVITGHKGQTRLYSTQKDNTRILPTSLMSSDPQPCVESKRSKADRVEAIRATAAALRHRLDAEAQRLSDLLHTKQHQNSVGSTERDPFLMDVQHKEEHLGCLPGIHNLDEQASLNQKLENMDAAAKRIQALYRGHTVRKSKYWQLPSGRSMYQTLEEARHRSSGFNSSDKPAVQLASANYPSVVQSKIQQQHSTPGLMSDSSVRPVKTNAQQDGSITSLYGTSSKRSPSQGSVLASFTNKQLALKQSSINTSGEGSFPSYSSKSEGSFAPSSTHHEGSYAHSSAHHDDRNERLRKILKKHSNEKGDRYSVINIFARNYPGLRRQQLNEEVSDTEKIIAEAYEQDEKTSPQVSPLPSSLDDYFTEESYKDLPVFTEQRPVADDRKPQSPSSAVAPLSAVGQRTLMSPKQDRSDSDISEKLFSPCSTRHDVLTPVPPPTQLRGVATNGISTDSGEEHSIGEITPQDLNPVLTSTKRLTTTTTTTRSDNNDSDVSLSHIQQRQSYHNAVEVPPNRMSPNTLERRLRAEINMFDSVGDSLQQLDEMERVRNLVQAQQETVSLAQVLKSRHLAHQNELAKMSAEAKEKTAISAKEVEAARLATAEASANALKAIAEIKSKAAEEVMLSAKKLTEIQNQATSTTLEALDRVDKARQTSADAYEFAVRRQIADVEKVTTAAATAASTTAVESALRHHREQLEELRRRAFAKVSKTYSSTNVAKDSVSGSYTVSQSATSKFSTSNSSQIHTAETSYSDVFETNQRSEDRTLSEEITAPAKFQNSPSPTQTKYNQKAQNSTPKTKDDRSSISESITLIKDSSDDKDVSSVVDDDKDASSVVEEVDAHNEEDKELSEALFSVKKYKEKTSSVSICEEESIHSIHSEEKFHSSFTEEEFKNDYHMVLPSENHRRKSLDRKDYLHSGNDTSSDELITPRNVGKWNKKRSKSPFADEETFSRFTADVVRQYIQEEEVRAKHQAALLALREKAIIEKTKAEMAYLEMQKKNLKTKGVNDEKMPPIAKKQRALILKLQAEQTEIRRLKGVFKQASHERKAMLHQEKEIQRIRESTQKLWNKMEVLDKGHNEDKSASPVGTVEEANEYTEETPNAPSSNIAPSSHIPDEIVEDIPEHVMSGSENLSGSKSTNNNIKASDLSTIAKDKSSLSKDLKKLQYRTSKRYLTDREKKLQSRRQQFNEMMERESMLKDWRQKIQDEEQKLKADIKRVLEKGGADEEDEKISSVKQDSDERTTELPSSTFSVKKKQDSKAHVETDASIGEELSSIADEYSSEKDSKNTTITESIGKPPLRVAYRPKSSSSAPSVGTSGVTSQEKHKYSNEDFEEASAVTSKSVGEKKVEKYRHDDDSFTEGASDASDIEQRLKGLEHELYRRKTELQRLRKRKEREVLKHKEQELRKELQAVEHLINCENTEQLPDSISRVQQPRVLSPRSTLDSVILPEKPKILTDKESRKSLDFHDKETRKSSSLQEKDVSDILATTIDRSIKEDISRTDVSTGEKSTDQIKKKNVNESPSHSTTSELRSSSVGKAIGNDVDDLSGKSTSSVTIELVIEKQDTERSSIVEELSEKDDGRSVKEVKGNYEDDFFESVSSKRTTPSKYLGDDHISYDDDFEETVATSGKYSSHFDIPEVAPNATRELADERDFSNTDKSTSDKWSHVDSKVSASQAKVSAALLKQTENAVNTPLSSASLTQSSSSKHTDMDISEDIPVPLDEKNATLSSSSTSVVVQPDGFSKSNVSSALGFRVNDRILVEETMPGTVRFLGKTPFSPVLVAGIELDTAMGTNNGSFQGNQYFTCAQDFGLFTTIERLTHLDIPKEQAASGLKEDASESSTVNDLDELQIISDVPKDDEDFEFETFSEKERSNNMRVDKDFISSIKLKDRSSTPSDKSPLHSTSLNHLRSREIASDDKLAVDLDVKSHSSSEVESIDVEIPSPAKLDLSPLADSITDSIMKTLLAESASIPQKHFSKPDDDDVDDVDDGKFERDSLQHEMEDSEIFARSPVPSASPQASVDGATDQLLKDAVDFMINIRKKKLSKETSKPSDDKLLSLLTDDKAESPGEEEDDDHALDADALTKRLNELEDVHDQLGLLLGDSELDDEEGEGESFDKVSVENLLLPPRGFGTKEPEFEIPYTERETYACICNAYDNILRCESSLDDDQRLGKDISIEVPTGGNTNLDENSTKLYKKLIYDITKSLLYDIKDFRDLQTIPRPLWMKMRKKTFSKFTRKTHTLTEPELRHQIAHHVCSCLDLRSGRPTLEKLRRKLPLNLSKKDYVDAVLVEELREEEAQWTDYDEDEVRVKFQLADALLDSLIQETVELLSSIY